MARRASRKAARLYPAVTRVAHARDTGFAWWQWWVMTLLTLTGAVGDFAFLGELPMFLFVMYAQLI